MGSVLSLLYPAGSVPLVSPEPPKTLRGRAKTSWEDTTEDQPTVLVGAQDTSVDKSSQPWPPRPASPDRWGDPPATPMTEASDASGATGMTTKLEGAWMQSQAVQRAGFGYGRPWRDGWKRSGRNVLKYMRRDFGELGWSYHGLPARDTSLDNLANQEWSAVQLFRSLPAARNRSAPSPTFTGAQVEERIAQCRSRIQARKEEVVELRLRTNELKSRIRQLKQELEDMETELHNTEDLVYEADGKIRDEKDDLEDLEDLRLVALAWLQESTVTLSITLPSP
ncbi:hypothetical protein PQX77_005363 [Marasmius sp. AFHP31]|nr:hypothetical protein PQX77_005363 [Marasmius sp. AFHP31]